MRLLPLPLSSKRVLGSAAGIMGKVRRSFDAMEMTK
jgi:hypothetical protein